MSARKPVLPELTTAADWAERTAEATAELRAAEAVIRAARGISVYSEKGKWEEWSEWDTKWKALEKSLARLDALRGKR